MAEIVNLNRARKAKAKAEKAKTAEANRIQHGTPKALRNLAERRKDKADRNLSAHELEKPRSVGEADSGSVSASDHKKDDN